MKTEIEIKDERILELQEQVKKLTSNTVLAEVKSFTCLYGTGGKERCSYECAYCKAKNK